jgi:hypothetical protein
LGPTQSPSPQASPATNTTVAHSHRTARAHPSIPLLPLFAHRPHVKSTPLEPYTISLPGTPSTTHYRRPQAPHAARPGPSPSSSPTCPSQPLLPLSVPLPASTEKPSVPSFSNPLSHGSLSMRKPRAASPHSVASVWPPPSTRNHPPSSKLARAPPPSPTPDIDRRDVRLFLSL